MANTAPTTPTAAPKFAAGKTAAGEMIHVREALVSHVITKADGSHVAFAGDPKTATPIHLDAGHWDAIKG